MYRIINTNDGVEIGCTEAPRFIRKSSAGCYVQTDELAAQGIAFKGTPYNLRDREGVGAEETVLLVEFDGGEVVGTTAEAEAQNRADIDYIAMETGVELE